jgi:hypothetical protein
MCCLYAKQLTLGKKTEYCILVVRHVYQWIVASMRLYYQQFLNYVIIIKAKVNLPQAWVTVTVADFDYPV